MTSMTPEEIRQHVNEVWDDDYGNKFLLADVGEKFVVYADPEEDDQHYVEISGWLANNNLPQSLRKKPRMVKAPGWVVKAPHVGKWAVWCCNDHQPVWVFNDYATEQEAIIRAKFAAKVYASVAIQAPGSDEMEVIKGFDV